MFGLVASSGIVSEPLARASREDVAKRFDAVSAALWTVRSSTQTALGSVTVLMSAVSRALRCHAEVRPCFAA